MNKMIFILSTFLLASIANCNSKMLQDNGEAAATFSSVECSMKIVNTYTGLDETDYRSSMIPSDLIKSSCIGVENSCCTDNEYEIMNKKTEKNLGRIFEGLSEIKNAIKLLPKETDFRIKELVLDNEEQSEDEFIEITTSFKKIRQNSTKLIKEINDSFKMVTDYSAGYSCSICKAENHANFKVERDMGEKILRMIFDIDYCEDLFNSPLLLSTLDFYAQLNHFMTITGSIGQKYGQHIENDFEQSGKQIEEINQTRISCLASENDLSKKNSCLELCFEMARPNSFLLSVVAKQLGSFTTLVNDYFGDQTILKQMKNTNSEDNLEEKSFMDFQEIVSVFVDKFQVKHILEFDEEHEEVNLEQLKIHPIKGSGWNLHKSRRGKWEMFESQSILVVSQILILIVAISKMD